MAPTPDERERRKLEAQLEKEHSQKIIELLRESSGMTAKELGAKLGKRPETVAKWLRPLKKLGVVEQIDDRRGGTNRTWYRLAERP
jgi:DNA-binding transcriptional ArsR family regulator